MSGEFEKYAVYWVPKGTDALARFGTSWTGWCAERGEHRPRGEFPGVSAAVPAITRQVWRHGFHAVIKAPFRLQEGRSRFSVEHALARVIEESVAFRLPSLRLAVIGGSVAALVPHQDCAALGALVDRVGEAMAPLETAPPANGFAETPALDGIAVGTIGEGIESLVQLPATDAHRFHMPLTDRLPLETAFRVMEELQPLLEPLMGEPRRLHDVALMGDPGEGRPLRVLQRYDLSDAPLRRGANPMPCHGPYMLAPMLNDPMVGTELAI
jgi:hypothetical protein